MSTSRPSSPTNPTPPPPWARPSHAITTPRMILRSPIPDDAEASTVMFYDPLNSPFGGLVGAMKTIEERRALLAKRGENAMKGENAFLVCVLTSFLGLEDILAQPSVQKLKVHDGYLIGSAGFNFFALRPNPEPNSTKSQLLVTNTGALIHHAFARRGLALETLQGTIEYGIDTLDCDLIEAETASINLPYRALMRSMCLGDFEKPGSDVGTDENGLEGEEETVYSFGRNDWKEAKEKMKASGKWYL